MLYVVSKLSSLRGRQLTSATVVLCAKNKGNLDFVLISQVTCCHFPLTIAPRKRPPSLISRFLSRIPQYIHTPTHITQRYYYCDKRWVVFSQLALTTRQKPVRISPNCCWKRPIVQSSFQAMMRLKANSSVIVWWRRMKSRCYFLELESLARLVVLLYLRSKSKTCWPSLFSQLCSSKWSLFITEATTNRNVNLIEKLSFQTQSNLCGQLLTNP